jgi:hypothetical protein
MSEDDLLSSLPLLDRLQITALDLTLTGAPRPLIEACVVGYRLHLELPCDRPSSRGGGQMMGR